MTDAAATAPLIAEFDSAQAILAAAKRVRREGFAVRDALTPFPVPELSDLLRASASPMRGMMAVAGFGMAAAMFALQEYSAVHAYPFDSGGRPLNSWPVFLLVPFEVGVLAAAVAGFLAFLWRCDLPRLHHPLFAYPGIERATQDRFFLLVDGQAPDEDAGRRLRRTLAGAGALSVGEMGP